MTIFLLLHQLIFISNPLKCNNPLRAWQGLMAAQAFPASISCCCHADIQRAILHVRDSFCILRLRNPVKCNSPLHAWQGLMAAQAFPASISCCCHADIQRAILHVRDSFCILRLRNPVKCNSPLHAWQGLMAAQAFPASISCCCYADMQWFCMCKTHFAYYDLLMVVRRYGAASCLLCICQ